MSGDILPTALFVAVVLLLLLSLLLWLIGV